MRTEVTDLAGLLRLAIDDFAAKTHTSIPGSVVSYDPSTKKASVQPLVQKRIWQKGQLTPMPLPVIYNVPVQFPGTSRWQISGDLQPGDTGMIVFSEASLDAWLQGSGAQTDPQDDRRFNLNDAIFVPGVSPFGAPGIPGVSSGLLLQYGSGGSPAKVQLNSDGSVVINSGSQGVARNGDTVQADMTTDPSNMAILMGYGISPPLKSKITGGSSTVKSG